MVFIYTIPAITDILKRDPTSKHAGMVPTALTIAYLDVLNIVLESVESRHSKEGDKDKGDYNFSQSILLLLSVNSKLVNLPYLTE